VSTLERILPRLTYLYLLRFPLLTAAAVVGFCVAALTFARSLLANAFDISWPWGIFWLSLTAFVTAWVIMITWRLVLLYGAERFGAEVFPISPNVKWWHIAGSSIIALPPVGGAVYYSILKNAWGIAEAVHGVFEALLGALAALSLLALAELAHKLLTPSEFAQERPDVVTIDELAQTSPDMFLPLRGRHVTRFGFIERFIRWVERVDKPSQLAQRIMGWLCRGPLIGRFCRVPESIGRGYFKYSNHEVVSVLPGHSAALILFALTFTLYLLVGVFKWWNLGEPPLFPTLAYVLLLLMWLCWGLSGAAFFLDRFRIPVIALLLVVLGITSMFPSSDYHYSTTDSFRASGGGQQASTQLPPSEEGNPVRDDSIIVVAANGGGIQAAAWTARVLTGLEEQLGDDFGRSIRLVSSVSGGSVGAMYFVAEYDQDGPPSGKQLDRIVQRAEGSSLDEIAWGLTYPDLARLFLSYGFGWDRGRALEEAWLKTDPMWANRDNITTSLSKWQEDVAAGGRPGSIFNTTNADNGERLPLSTIDLPPGSEGRETQAEFFKTLGPKDVSVLTATRLSAAFPYVSPAARADVNNAGAHIVDGGYYDNFGMSSLVEWLDAELEKGEVKEVLVVRIHGAPTGDNSDNQRISNRRWFYQVLAPLSTLLNVRQTGQLSYSNITLNLLREKWEGQVRITPVVFEFDNPNGPDPPLSWHLNEEEKAAIEKSWANKLKGSDFNTSKEFLERAQDNQ
jgi:predicted acylesterase/phospholipase RssA